MKLFKYSLIALISISLFSCEKDDDTTEPTTPIAQTNTEKLCGKNFKLTDYTYIENGNTITTGRDTNFLPACIWDDIIRFETSGIYTENLGAIKCDTTEPQTETGTWAFYDSETKLIFDPGPDADTVNIIRNDGTVLTLVYSYIFLGDIFEFRSTYTAQ